MNRLTKRGKRGTTFAVINGSTVQRVVFQRREYPDKVIWDKYDIGVVIDRLAEYEDLGYEPDEIKAMRTMGEHDAGMWDMFLLITSTWYGKQMYFLESSGIVYSRMSCSYMKVEDAYTEFLEHLEDGNECV